MLRAGGSSHGSSLTVARRPPPLHQLSPTTGATLRHRKLQAGATTTCLAGATICVQAHVFSSPSSTKTLRSGIRAVTNRAHTSALPALSGDEVIQPLQQASGPEQQHAEVSSSSSSTDPSSETTTWVAAPLVRRGPASSTYLALALRFPGAATAAQRQRGQRGVSLDFILDTGSTVNILNPAIARELGLPIVGMQPAGAGAAGAIATAPIFLLGDVQLDFLAPEDRFTFMTGLQAAGLTVPSPGCAGILGRPFIDCFPAVELRFGTNTADGSRTEEIRFHQEYDVAAATAATSSIVPTDMEAATEAAPEQQVLRQVPMQILGETGLWGLQLQVATQDGRTVVVPALVDSGAPVTVLNTAAAQALGLQQQAPAAPEAPKQPQGLLGKLLSGIKAAVPAPPTGGAVTGLQQLAVGVELSVLRLPGAATQEEGNGNTQPAAGSANTAEGPALDGNNGDGLAASTGGSWSVLGTITPMVGDLPGFAMLGVAQGSPAAILGLDAFACCEAVVICPKERLLLL